MQAIDTALPESDGLACFNRMYLQVTLQMDQLLQQGFFANGPLMSHLDVVFANQYFDAVDAEAANPAGANPAGANPAGAHPAGAGAGPTVPPAWQPLMRARVQAGIEPIQFALAGMNAHINHDLPLAVVTACSDLGTAPGDGANHADYQKVDQLLDAAEQSVRQSFESGAALAVDRHLQAVANVVCNWSINAARDVAWDTALALWDVRDHPLALDLFMGALARTVGMASRGLLVAV